MKDFVAGVRLLDNRSDEIAWFRLLRLHDGIGPARARTLLDTLDPAAARRRVAACRDGRRRPCARPHGARGHAGRAGGGPVAHGTSPSAPREC